jgi:hypothetical protein
MQYVNDDMDELFKRAAENYPLDTNSADWNKVLAALQNQSQTQTISEKKGNKNGRFLWLLLLLPIGLICNQLYSPGSLKNEGISKTGVEGNHSSNKITTLPKDINSNKVEDAATDNNSVTNRIVDITENSQKDPNTKGSTANLSNRSVQTQENPSLSKSNSSKTKTPGYYSGYNDAFSSSQKRNQSVSNTGFINEELFHDRIYIPGIAVNKEPLDEFSTSVSKSMNPLFQSPEQEVKQNIQISRRKKFYTGVMGGIDATTVKFQKIENAGFSYGLLFGYQVNKKWSIETGAFLERKYYYSDGKYINTSKIYLPPNTRIDDASGNCKMIEIPLAVKYNFSTHKNSNWFGTLGTSSYIMKKESYNYNYYYGTTGPVPHKKEYKNSSTNLFTALSVSGGYTHRLGNFGDVRVEPYLKLPVSGMGIGKLPFLSTGLQVGVTRKF